MIVFALIGRLVPGRGEVLAVCSTKEKALAAMAEEMGNSRSRCPRSGLPLHGELIVEEWEIDGKCVANWKALAFEDVAYLSLCDDSDALGG